MLFLRQLKLTFDKQDKQNENVNSNLIKKTDLFDVILFRIQKSPT